MKRLTKRDEFGNADIIGLEDIDLSAEMSFKELNLLTNALNKFAAYEEAEEQGRLVRLPCKLGDTVYVNALCIYMPHLHHKPRYYNAEIIAIKRTKQKKLQLLVKPLPKDCRCSRASNRWFGESSIGKTVFLTEAEAEAKLAKMKGGASDG